MIKRLALLICCILLLPTIAAAQQGSTNYGDFWVGGQVGGLFASHTDTAVTGGVIVGYNFCMPYRPSWQRYFGVALDFSGNPFNHKSQDLPKITGSQAGVSLLARAQYPLMGDENFTRGKLVPFIMAGPTVVWTNSDFTVYPSDRETVADWGVVAEVGLEYFIIPQLSIGPSFRYRHLWVEGVQGLDQYMVLGRLAYHF
jgi:hypothetical protein